MRILTYTDDNPAAKTAARLGAELAQRLGGEITFLTARSGTAATEEPPPVGVEFPLEEQSELQPGIRTLTQTMKQLAEEGFLESQESVIVKAVRNGYLFLGTTTSGGRVPFYERYGHLIDVLNYEVDQHEHDLVVVAAPRRSGLGRFLTGDSARPLALDLHSSVLLVRGGDADSRLLVCADGSPSARRLFPLLRQLLPAVRGSVDLIWVRDPGADEEEIRLGQECVQRARAWLDSCGKPGGLLVPQGERPQEQILEAAGHNSVIVVGASLKHDVHHRVRGSLPLQILAQTKSSVLLANLPPEVDANFFQETSTC